MMKEINFDLIDNVVFVFLFSDSFRFGNFSLAYIIRRMMRVTIQDSNYHTKMVQVLAGYDWWSTLTANTKANGTGDRTRWRTFTSGNI